MEFIYGLGVVGISGGAAFLVGILSLKRKNPFAWELIVLGGALFTIVAVMLWPVLPMLIWP